MPSAQTPTNLTDLPIDVLKLVADNLQNSFSAGSLASVNETSKKLYEASKHALWEIVHWDEKSFATVDLEEAVPSTWKDIQYVYFAKSSDKDYFWTKLNQIAPEHKTRYGLAYHFFPNFQAIVETSKGNGTHWAAYISPTADRQTVLAELIKAAYRLNSKEFANIPIQEFIYTVPVPEFSSCTMPPRPTDLELIGAPPMSEGKLRERVEYVMNARPKLWFRQPADEDLLRALAPQSERPHGTMYLKNMDGATFTAIDLYMVPDREESSLNTIKSIYAYILFVAMTSLFSQHPHVKEGKTWLWKLQCLDYEHLQNWISMLVSWSMLHQLGCTVPYQIHAEISCPMSGDEYSTHTLKTWAFLLHAIDEAGDNEDAILGIPKRVTIDINKAVIPAFEGKVLRAVLPVDVSDDAEYDVDLVDDTTPI